MENTENGVRFTAIFSEAAMPEQLAVCAPSGGKKVLGSDWKQNSIDLSINISDIE